jgi:hypothetical protein
MIVSAGQRVCKYRNSAHCLQQILVNEGVSALYKGAACNLLRGFVGAFMLVGYDNARIRSLEWMYPHEAWELEAGFGHDPLPSLQRHLN